MGEGPHLSRPEGLRPQYHFRQSPNGLCAWDVRRLVKLADPLPVVNVALADIEELDEAYWFQGFNGPPTTRSIVEHARLIEAADLKWPILLCAQGRVMDGMHRVAKALLEGRDTIQAKRFEATPEPDHIGLNPDQLPYEEA